MGWWSRKSGFGCKLLHINYTVADTGIKALLIAHAGNKAVGWGGGIGVFRMVCSLKKRACCNRVRVLCTRHALVIPQDSSHGDNSEMGMMG